MSRTKFTQVEFDEILKLVSKKTSANKEGQKKIRKRIRNMGFRWSELSETKAGFNEEGVRNLLSSGVIQIVGKGPSIQPESIRKPIKKRNKSNLLNSTQPLMKIFEKEEYVAFRRLNTNMLAQTGFYSIRLKDYSMLPSRYQSSFEERPYRYREFSFESSVCIFLKCCLNFLS